MSYPTMQVIASALSALIFVSVIVVMLAYAFWPSNKTKFERAARQPLDDDINDRPLR